MTTIARDQKPQRAHARGWPLRGALARHLATGGPMDAAGARAGLRGRSLAGARSRFCIAPGLAARFAEERRGRARPAGQRSAARSVRRRARSHEGAYTVHARTITLEEQHPTSTPHRRALIRRANRQAGGPLFLRAAPRRAAAPSIQRKGLGVREGDILVGAVHADVHF